MRFRKKPAEIEARQTGEYVALSVLRWIRRGGAEAHLGHAVGSIEIVTLEGTMTASAGDWIIQGVQGEFYPCKRDIFVATYEPVDE